MPERHSDGSPHRLDRRQGLTLAALLLAGGLAAWSLSTWPVKLRYPGEWCGIEGMRLAEMQHLRHGIPIYAPASAERFDATIYGPLYYLAGARLIDPAKPAYFPLRLLSALAVLGCAGFAGWLAFRISGCALAGGLAPLSFLSYAFVSLYGISGRADSCALLLSFGAVLVAHQFRESPKILLAMPLFLLSFFYKQQYVAAPLATILFLALERRYRLAAAFAGLMTAGAAVGLILFQFLIFRGQDFLLHFLRYNLAPFSWVQFKGAMAVFGILLLVPLLVGLESLRVHREKFLACYLVCAVASALLGAGKEGSDTNYFLECIFILSVLFAALLARRIPEPARAIELLVLLVVTLFTGQFFTPPPPSPRDFDLDRALQDYLRTNFPPGTRALSYYAGDMLRAGLDMPVSDIYQRTLLTRQGALDDRDIVTQLEKHYFAVVVVDFDLQTERERYWLDMYLTERMRRAIQAEYQLAAVMEMPGPEKLRKEARFYVWVPQAQARAVFLPRLQTPGPVSNRHDAASLENTP
jgi:hypothetical protein